jgi:hypothetical protein
MSMGALKGYESQELTPAVLEVDVVVEKIQCTGHTDKATENSKSNYTLNVSLSERKRRPEGLTIGFTLELTGASDVALITIEGSAKLTGPQTEITESLAVAGGKAPPKVVETIYEKLYGLVYVLAGSMKVPYPLPNLLKKGS